MTETPEEPLAPSFSESTADGPQAFQPRTIREYERVAKQEIVTADAESRRRQEDIGFKVCLGLFVAAFLISFSLGVGANGDLQSWMQAIFGGTVGAAAGYATGTRSK